MGAANSKPSDKRQAMTRTDFDEKVVDVTEQKRIARGVVVDSADVSEGIQPSLMAKWDAELEKDATFNLARLILNNNDPFLSLKSRPAEIADQKIFNLDLRGTSNEKDKKVYPGPVTNQASSGRCWLFATTNVLRYNVVEALKLGDFELSQSYLYFYDKLEKANYFLENVLELTDEPLDGRLMSFLNMAPVNDGGQWDMAFNIVEKYGIVPQQQYPDAFSASNSARMNWILTAKLREYGLRLRKNAKSEGASIQSLRLLKSKFIAEVYSTLCITLGTPPKPDTAFTWEYYDKDKKFHSWKGTPLEFYVAYGKRKNMDPKDSFSLINDPRNDYEKHFTVKRLGNVWGGPRVRYVNAPVTALEDAVIAGIKANTPLFFGCDVGKFMDGKKGIMDTELFNIEAAFGYKYGLNKAERLEVGESAATHAMVITAVHLGEDGRPVKYKVENSWSKESGEDGWYMMTAAWFAEFVYQIVVPSSIVDKKWVKVLDQEPIELEPWDPMGALA